MCSARTSVGENCNGGKPIVVRVASSSDSAAWNDFLATHSAGSFYHLYDWQKIVKTCFAHEPLYQMAWQADRVVGVLPLVLGTSRLFGKILCSVPFVNYGGPCANSDEIAALLAEDAVRTAESLRADYLELRCAGPLTTNLPASLRKVSMMIALDSDPDIVLNRFAREHRKNIRRAYKNRLEVRSGGVELLPAFYDVLQRSWRDLGTPLYQPTYFQEILKTFPDSTRIFVCSHAGKPVCVALNGYYNATVEGMWAGALPLARKLQANYVLYWEMIRHACLNGFQRFHLGRSTVGSGSEQFKKQWNAESRQLYFYFYRPDGGPMPQINVDNPKFRLAIGIWRHLPIWLVRRLGPHLARSIP